MADILTTDVICSFSLLYKELVRLQGGGGEEEVIFLMLLTSQLFANCC